jgi:hypothetical protein
MALRNGRYRPENDLKSNVNGKNTPLGKKWERHILTRENFVGGVHRECGVRFQIVRTFFFKNVRSASRS